MGITKSSEVLSTSRVRDWILEWWTPSSLWIPEHSIQVRMPRLVDSHVGSERNKKRIKIIKKWFLFTFRKQKHLFIYLAEPLKAPP